MLVDQLCHMLSVLVMQSRHWTGKCCWMHLHLPIKQAVFQTTQNSTTYFTPSIKELRLRQHANFICLLSSFEASPQPHGNLLAFLTMTMDGSGSPLSPASLPEFALTLAPSELGFGSSA